MVSFAAFIKKNGLTQKSIAKILIFSVLLILNIN